MDFEILNIFLTQKQSSEVPDGHVLRLYAVAKVRILPGPYSSLNKNSEAAIAVSLIKSNNFGSVQFALLVISLLSDPIAAVQMISFYCFGALR